MGSVASPPLPPEITRQAQQRRPFEISQQDSPPEMGQQDEKRQMLAMLGTNIQALEKGVEETAKMVSQIHPPMASFLVPVKQGIEAMKKEFVSLAQRTGVAGNSPQASQAPPPNPGMGPEPGEVPPTM